MRRDATHLADHRRGGAGAKRRGGRDELVLRRGHAERLAGAAEVREHGAYGVDDPRTRRPFARALERLLHQRLGRKALAAGRRERGLDLRAGGRVEPRLEPRILRRGGGRGAEQQSEREQDDHATHALTVGRW